MKVKKKEREIKGRMKQCKSGRCRGSKKELEKKRVMLKKKV